MKKIGDSTNTATDSGEWTEGNPAAGAAATLIKADWLNTIQRELVGVVQGAGIPLDPHDEIQVYKAIRAIASKVVGDEAYFDSITAVGFVSGDPALPYMRLALGDRIVRLQPLLTYRPPDEKDVVIRDAIRAAGLVNADPQKPYFLDENGGILRLQRAFTYTPADVDKVVGRDGVTIVGLVGGDPLKPYVQSLDGNILRLQRALTYTAADEAKVVARDSITAVGLVGGDPLIPYMRDDAGNILRLQRALPYVAADEAKVVARDGITTVGLVGGDQGIPYMRDAKTNDILRLQRALPYTPVQQGGGASQSSNKLYLGWDGVKNGVRVQVDSTDIGVQWNESNRPKNTAVMGIPGWWRCADTGLIRQRVSVLVGDFGPALSGTVTWPVTFPVGCDVVRISFRQATAASNTGFSAAYADASRTGCSWRIDEWGVITQSPQLTLIIEAEGY